MFFNRPIKHIIILIDVSYSMYSHINPFINSLNKFISDLRKNIHCDYRLTLGQFNTQLNYITEFTDVHDISHFNISNFNIHGTTALYDAISLTIKNFSNNIENTNLFVISDGDDNASFLYTKEDTDKMIEQVIMSRKWNIVHCHTDLSLFNVPTFNFDVNDICNIFDNLKV